METQATGQALINISFGIRFTAGSEYAGVDRRKCLQDFAAAPATLQPRFLRLYDPIA